ncbi:MAG: hypothetical protein HC821_00175 [Lewinella sp.]|nr:hypothetical protein [Lewinella sp.]
MLINSPNSWKKPAVELYYHLCQSYLHPTAEELSFEQLILRVKTLLPGFSPAEQNTLLKLLLNQAIHRLNQNASPTQLTAALDLYRLGSNSGLLVQNGRISTFTFNNVLGIALRLGQTDYAAAFS